MDTQEILKVHHRHPKTGKVISEIPYRMHCFGDKKLFEKPAGSGAWYFESGEPAPAEICPKLPPKVYKLTQEQELAALKAENLALKAQLDPVQKELAAISKEQEQLGNKEVKKAVVKNETNK